MSEKEYPDPYAPKEIADRIDNVGLVKANLAFSKTLMLAILAGVYIGIGAILYILVLQGQGPGQGLGQLLGFGLSRWIGGFAFSIGLIFVVIAGAELFTGNNLIVMACMDRKVTIGQLLRNWLIVYAGNFIGSVFLAGLVFYAGLLSLNGDGMAISARNIASYKVEISFTEALLRGVLCNILVCLAIWLSFAARRVSGKILAMIFPVAAFVALGFEHSIANMFFIPLGMLAGAEISISDMMGNLVPVTLGNMIGGGGLVAATYYLIYIRKS
ncbi:MAG: formate/nitrite transporter family protein [Alphaproteobacteria bacterium]|nr:formate/nitrite transporter family protein [Alphaproteobacteria bacterium]